MTTHDSSLSCVIHSILAARLGKREEAYGLFERALDIDLDPEAGGAAEGIHIANCGGIWQAVVIGFAGMRWAYESAEPRFEPRLPAHWTSVEFPLRWRGGRYAVSITPSKVEVREECS
jgi:kojibiose phosphorylase